MRAMDPEEERVLKLQMRIKEFQQPIWTLSAAGKADKYHAQTAHPYTNV